MQPRRELVALGGDLSQPCFQLDDPPQEGLLDREHLRGLPDSEQRDVLVLEGLHGSPPSGNAKRPAVRIAPPAACVARQLISWPAPCWYRPRSCGAWPPRGPGW